MRQLRVVIVTGLLSLALSGVASAQTDSRAEQENLEWQRQVIEAAIAQTQAELAALEKVLVNPDAVFMYADEWYVVDRAAVELALQIFPLYQLASADARSSLEAQIPALVPALIAIERTVGEGAVSLPELLEMEEQERWDRITRRGASRILLLWANPVKTGGDELRAEISDLQGLLAAVNDELDGLRPAQPDLVDEDPDDTPAIDDSPDDAPTVDKPQEEPSDTSAEASGFAGTWSTRSGNRMELTGSGSSFKGPYGRVNKADENGVRTLGVAGEMDMQVTGERTLEGFWIKGSASAAKCTVPKNGSDYWGQQLMVFDEAFMSWTGAWTYCDGSLWRDSDGIRKQEP